MNTKAKLIQALKEAMKARNSVKKTTLRMALATIKNAEVQARGELGEPDVLGILQKEVKSRRETIQDAKKANRPDLEAAALAEITILEAFLPQPFSIEELEKMVKEAIAESGASSPRDMGKVMKILIPRVRGRADGRTVSNLVRQSLQG
ncbi:MAG: GatB/YqeY domain-containing protein [Anaerolineales bacterium]